MVRTIFFVILLVAQSAFAQRMAWYDGRVAQFSRIVQTNPTNACVLVTVYSALKARDESGKEDVYLQKGVGWVFVDRDQQLSIATPAHVVSHGHAHFAQCGNQIFDLTLKKSDETLDLAHLRVQSSPSLNPVDKLELLPLFWIPPRGQNRETMSLPDVLQQFNTETNMALTGSLREAKPELSYIEPEQEHRPVSLKSYGSVIEKLNHPSTPVLDAVYIFQNSGVRPGMSGSPMFEVVESHRELKGMVIKSEANGSSSIVIPVDIVFDYLSESNLFYGPGSNFAKAPAPFDFALRSSLVKTATGLEKIYEIVVQDQQTKKNFVFKDACDDTYPQTSSWQSVSASTTMSASLRAKLQSRLSGNDGARSEFKVIQVRGGRGDYGDSGGGTNRSTSNSWKVFQTRNGQESSVLKHERSCSSSRIIAPWGASFATMSNSNGKLTRVDSISAFGQVLRDLRLHPMPNEQGKTWQQRIQDRIAIPTEICSEFIDLSAGESVSMSMGKELASSEAGVYAKQYMRPTGSGGFGFLQRSAGQLSCENGGRGLRFQFKNPSSSAAMIPQFDFVLSSDQTLTGTIWAGDRQCAVQLSANNVRALNPYSYEIRDPLLKGSVDLRETYPYFRINITDIAANCRASRSAPFFLWEQVWFIGK